MPAIHPALQPGNIAVITGAASGIGLAVARRLVALGLKVAAVDLPGPALEAAVADLNADASAPGQASAFPCDVADPAAIAALAARVAAELGPVAVLMNNAAIQPGSDILDTAGTWRRVVEVNLWGVINGSQAFVPGMIAAGRPGLVINTGSKQGITTPPGDPAYNVAKAGVKVFTEALQHDLRNRPGCQVEARLLIPGFVFTGLTRRDRTEKPAGAWTADETADFLFTALGRDDFYILCPDNDVDRRTDERRIAWAAGDIIENRPPLSRWHPDYAAPFADFLKR